MAAKPFFVCCLFLSWFYVACSNDSSAPKRQDGPLNEQPAQHPIPEEQAPPAAVEAPAYQDRAKKPGSTTASRPAIPKMPIRKTVAPAPTAYINAEKVVMYESPATSAKKTGAFKIYEEVFVLETIKKDEQGQVTAYPTWYKVQRTDNKTGWVIARTITLN